MTFNRGLFSSASGEYTTPRELYCRLNEEFAFTLDPAATDENHLCEEYYTEEDDGLALPWYGSVFVNPPYGRGIIEWVRKCYIESLDHARVVVGLLPSRTDTKWWHEYVMKADDIRFLRGRLKFGGSTNSAPFPSCVVVWRRKFE